jgi:hypothetical protein
MFFVVEILGVVNVVPVANSTPPVDTSYQFIVPAVFVASKLGYPSRNVKWVGCRRDGSVTAVRVMLVQAAAWLT